MGLKLLSHLSVILDGCDCDRRADRSPLCDPLQAIHAATNLFADYGKSWASEQETMRRADARQSEHGPKFSTGAFNLVQPGFHNQTGSMPGGKSRAISLSSRGGLSHGDMSGSASCGSSDCTMGAASSHFSPVPMHGGSPLQLQQTLSMEGPLGEVAVAHHSMKYGTMSRSEHHIGDMMMNSHLLHMHSVHPGDGWDNEHRPFSSRGGSWGAYRSAFQVDRRQLSPYDFDMSPAIYHQRREAAHDVEYSYQKHEYPHHKPCSEISHGLDAGAMAHQHMLMQRERLRRQHEVHQQLQALEHRFGSGGEYGSALLNHSHGCDDDSAV